MGAEDKEKRALIFTYGTLKRGFSNHILIQEMMATNDVVYIGDYQTLDKLPLVCGPYRVPFLLNIPGSGDRVLGELYSVSDRSLARMDELEGTSRGHYERLPLKVRSAQGEKETEVEVEVEAYYAHRSYAEELWRRNGQRGYNNYTAKEAQGYIKRKDRPQHLSFLEQIRIFVSSSDDDDDHHLLVK